MFKKLMYHFANTLATAILAAGYVHSFDELLPPPAAAQPGVIVGDRNRVDPELLQEACLLKKKRPPIRMVADVVVKADDDLVAQINENLNKLQLQIDVLNRVNQKPGPAGPAGKDGASGKDGSPGVAGPAGLDGKPGKDGLTPSVDDIVKLIMDKIGEPQRGPPGQIGPAGPAGLAGKDGKPGRNGTDGKSPTVSEIVAAVLPQIPKGPAGDRGPAGPQGAAGPAGPAGALGKTGAPGTDAVVDPAALAKQLPPFCFKVVDTTGRFQSAPAAEIYLGDQLNLVLQPVATGGVAGGIKTDVSTPDKPTTPGGAL